MEQFILIFIIFLAIAAIIVGTVQAFRRNTVAAVVLLVLFPGVLIFWAMIELFLKPPADKVQLEIILDAHVKDDGKDE